MAKKKDIIRINKIIEVFKREYPEVYRYIINETLKEAEKLKGYCAVCKRNIIYVDDLKEVEKR